LNKGNPLAFLPNEVGLSRRMHRLLPFLCSEVMSGVRRDAGSDEGKGSTALATRPKIVPKRPNLYRVLLLNDDYTPMEFVIEVLMRYFNKDEEQATTIMLHVHQNGVGECGVYTFEIAETKVTQVMDFALKHKHPLQCVLEKK
jgi:ATP-dependent Clp protease adaptor protein ClpS